MENKYSKKKIRNVYSMVSLIGKAHLDSVLPNQDYFLVKKNSFGTVIVVADGMGSKKKSDIGSKMVCKAVYDASQIWLKNNDNRNITLLKLIHNLWDIYIAPNSKEECGTTCLFALILKDKIILGKLGDGIIAYKINDDFKIFTNEKMEFSNMTQSMHSIKKISDWTIEEIENNNEDLKIMIATDGIAEDLIEKKIENFMIYLCDEILKIRDLSKRNKKLKQLIQNWPTKFSNDDKTLVIFERGELKKWRK